MLTSPTPPPRTCRWAALSGVGAGADNVYVVTNATTYKFAEFWAVGKGLTVHNVINTGRSVGDAR